MLVASPCCLSAHGSLANLKGGDDMDKYDFSDYNLKELFRIRDALATLRVYELVESRLYEAVETEIQRKAKDKVVM